MGDFLGFLGIFTYIGPEGISAHPYRRFAQFACGHDRSFAKRDIPKFCECGGARQAWFEVVRCPDCRRDLYYPPGGMLADSCEGGTVKHDPQPISIDTPPPRRRPRRRQ